MNPLRKEAHKYTAHLYLQIFCTSLLISYKCSAQFSMSRTTLGLLSLGLLDLGPKCQAFQFPPSLHIFHHSVSDKHRNGLSNTEADLRLHSFKQETATCSEFVAVPGIISLWYYFEQTLHYITDTVHLSGSLV